MTSTGVVREYHDEDGWGVIDGPDVPGGCWVPFSAIAMEGYRKLTAGQAVSFRAETAAQDGFEYRAVKVWTGETEPADAVADSTSGAYRSELTLTFELPPEYGR
ncbi:cold shock domain-containing protein [Micromonospora sp. CPCC 205371]|nr:cold shock domain-containing protein [Micromonospora sp. CPCC 205371]